MKPNRFLMLIAVNVVLLMMNLGVKPAALQAEEAGWADCCKFSTEGIGFCCNNCCWLDKCDSSSQCPLHQPT